MQKLTSVKCTNRFLSWRSPHIELSGLLDYRTMTVTANKFRHTSWNSFYKLTKISTLLG